MNDRAKELLEIFKDNDITTSGCVPRPKRPKVNKENVIVGANIHSDKGYSISTEEGYNAFAEQRNNRVNDDE